MKKLLIKGAAVLVGATAAWLLLAMTLNGPTPAVAADNLRDFNPVLSYTGGSGYYFSGTGTNDANGYTNAAKVIPIVGGTTVTFGLYHTGYSANYSNAITLYVRSAFGSGASDVATVGQSWRVALAAGGNTPAMAITNLTVVGAPYLWVQVENPASNPVSITNLVLRYHIATP